VKQIKYVFNKIFLITFKLQYLNNISNYLQNLKSTNVKRLRCDTQIKRKSNWYV